MEETPMEGAEKALSEVGFDTPAFHEEKFLRLVAHYSLRPEPLLVIGETGTGKELIAQAIHLLSGKEGRFEHILCPGIPSALIESVLFGHKRGAFTGAIEKQEGAFDSKDGTVFLDEIGDFPLELQPKLLKVLNNGTYRPLGEAKERVTTCRVISATNNEHIAREPNYRKDLYYRLGVLVIRAPTLRDEIQKARAQDKYTRQIYGHDGKQIWLFFSAQLVKIGPCHLTNDAINKLASYHWPGNYRELKSVLTRSYVDNAETLTGEKYDPTNYEGSFMTIDADMIQFDEDPRPTSEDVSGKISGMNLLEAEAYAHRLHARILEEKMNSIPNLKGHLRDLGRSDYATIRKRLRGQITTHRQRGQEIIS